ncbi:MAG: hypothetical protein M3067_03490 [Chloroflexota bacterium]|nr:hypothetical protein [Chloroflexota bacterium]
MSFRPAHWSRLAATLGALTLAVAACSNASPVASTGGGATPAAATPAAQATPAASTDLVMPSFNADLDLEAQLPNDFCNQKVTKGSFTGPDFLGSDPVFDALVKALGKSPSDVSVALGSVKGPECVGISLFALRIKGADPSQFEQLFVAEQVKKGTPATKTNIGGRDVWTYTDDSGTNILYLKGDVAFGVTAKTAADAAKGLAVMP